MQKFKKWSGRRYLTLNPDFEMTTSFIAIGIGEGVGDVGETDVETIKRGVRLRHRDGRESIGGGWLQPEYARVICRRRRGLNDQCTTPSDFWGLSIYGARKKMKKEFPLNNKGIRWNCAGLYETFITSISRHDSHDLSWYF